MRRQLICLFTLIFLWTTPAPAAEPRAVVEAFHSILIDVMRNADSLGIVGRYERLLPAVDEAFDLPRMIRIASGSAWRNADDSGRGALVDAFSRMSAGTYASQFSGFSGEKFETDGERPGPRESRLVATRIVTGKGETVPITYVLVHGIDPDDWRIADVLLNNTISELSVRRSEYRTIVEQGGVDGLVAALNNKADQLLKP